MRGIWRRKAGHANRLKLKKHMKIIIDSREQLPFAFCGEHYQDVTVSREALPVGDYSLAGLTDRAAIERKSLDDLVQCLGRERGRFERELLRAASLEMFCVVIESSWQELAQGQYRSRLNPRAACQSICAFMARRGIAFFFAGSRTAAEYVTYSLLQKYLEGSRKRLLAIVTAHDAAQSIGKIG